MEESAITDFICSFSASRLKGFRFPLAFSFSFFLSLELPKKALDPEEDLAEECPNAEPDVGVELEGPEAFRASRAAFAAASCSSSTNGFSSVSLRTLDLSCVTACFLLGSSYDDEHLMLKSCVTMTYPVKSRETV
jgi:hypothetical protein